MRMAYGWALAMSLLISAWIVGAQDDRVAPNEEILAADTTNDFNMPQGPRGQGGFQKRRNAMGMQHDSARPRGGMNLQGQEATDRWLETLRLENPQEYEQMMQLRSQNPLAFYEELRFRLKKERTMMELKNRPAVFDAINALPEEDREWVMHHIHPQQLNRVGNNPQKGKQHVLRTPQTDALEEEARALVDIYHQSQDKTERTKIREEIRKKLSMIFDLREEKRVADIEKINSELQKLIQTMEIRKSNRDVIIDQRLKQLTKDEEMVW